MNTDQSIVVAVTGASGSPYVVRLLSVLLEQSQTVDLLVSDAGCQVMLQEMGTPFPPATAPDAEWKSLIADCLSSRFAVTLGLQPVDSTRLSGILRVHQLHDFSAGIASGSVKTRGMVVCPCSTGTLSAIAAGASTNLIQRAAEVHLKERRKLILVPREMPLSRTTVSNMLTVTDAGAVILPAMPGFYNQPRTIGDLIDFVVARICDQLEVTHQLSQPWGSDV